MAKSVNINNTLQQINAQNPALGAAVRNTGSVPGPAMQVVVSARGQVQELNPVVNARTNPANNIQSAAPQTSVVKATGSVQITAAAAAPQISTVQTTGSAQITAAITPPTQPGMANKIEQIQQVAVLNSTNKTSSAGNQAHASASKQSVSISTSAHKQASQIATGQNSSSTPEPTAAQRSSQPAVSQSTSQAANSNNTNNSVNQTQTAGSPAGGNSTAVSAVPQGSLTGNMSTQILQTIQSPVLSNINPAAVVSLPFNPVGGLTMQNPISLNLSGNLGLGKAVQSGKTAGNAGLSFGDKISGQEQGVKDAQAKSQPIISFSTLSRIAHERDVQKENMLKLLGLLFGRVNKQEENDEDLEGMYGVWSDYIKQQREKKDQQQKEEQRKKEQKKKEEAEPELALA
ncbi:MAG: hypothetical protein LBQ83_00245 [Candidatus Margulisbacteria bacterium]|jgi:hypothetical protein|nr:hypothetical protein [Candidatus Margulisiibacteriota bacterium]